MKDLTHVSNGICASRKMVAIFTKNMDLSAHDGDAESLRGLEAGQSDA